MRPEEFAETAKQYQATELGQDATLILAGRLRSGWRINIYKGRLPEENASSIGHFLIVTANGRPNSNSVEAEIIPAGSQAVIHP
ncbi:MAG: hypothetical protein AAB834_07240, partial [Patescibacteria group bacterium]